MKPSTLQLLLLAALAAAGPARAADTAAVSFNGQSYGATRMGRVVKVVPNAVIAKLSAIGPDLGGPANPANPGCEQIYAELKRREYLFDQCGQQPGQSICKLLVKGLRMMAEGRPDTDTPIDPSAVRTFSVGAPQLSETDLDGLRGAVAAEFKVSPQAVMVEVTGERPAPAGDTFPTLPAGSASEKVARVLPFAAPDLAQFVSPDRLVTHNNIFACDLAAGKAGVVGHTVSTLVSVDRVPDAVVDLAWGAYGVLDQAKEEIGAETSPLVRAALIGYHLQAAMVAAGPVNDPLATPAALFTRLYDLASGAPVLRPAVSREALRAAEYPDTPYSATAFQAWSLQ